MCTCGMHSTQSVDHAYALVVTYMYLSLSVDLNAKAPTLRVSTEAKPRAIGEISFLEPYVRVSLSAASWAVRFASRPTCTCTSTSS